MDNSNEAAMRHGKESDGIDLLRSLRIVRSAGGALCTQANLYGKLARIEWQEEKIRLLKMLVFGLIGFACILCVMLFVGVLVLVLSWDTPYRILALSLILIAYGIGLGIAWQRIRALSRLNSQSFAATREELATDLALIKSRL
jgi:uncharacterized membrane protein YqjE